MPKTLMRCTVVLLFLMTVTLPVFLGCGKESTRPGNGDDQLGRPVTYFPLYVGYEARYHLLTAVGGSLGTTRFTVIAVRDTADFSGYIAVDSTPAGMDTFWVIPRADTVFQLAAGYAFSQRQPIVRNHDRTEISWPLYSVGALESPNRYTVIFHQLPETETVVLTRGGIFFDCGRTDLIAVYAQSGDTTLLGSEYFAPDIGRVFSSFRPFVESKQFVRELMQ